MNASWWKNNWIYFQNGDNEEFYMGQVRAFSSVLRVRQYPLFNQNLEIQISYWIWTELSCQKITQAVKSPMCTHDHPQLDTKQLRGSGTNWWFGKWWGGACRISNEESTYHVKDTFKTEEKVETNIHIHVPRKCLPKLLISWPPGQGFLR